MSAEVGSPRVAILVQQNVAMHLDRLARDARELIEQSGIASMTSMEEHQISNLLHVALETDSVEVLRNFILYQVGRDTKNTWRHAYPQSGTTFGETLILKIDELSTVAQTISAAVEDAEKCPVAPEPVCIDLVRQYLGQLYRCFYYAKKR